MSGTLALVLVGEMVKISGIDVNNQTAFGHILAFNTAVPCVFATICFYLAGSHYEAQKTQMKMEKEQALSVAAS